MLTPAQHFQVRQAVVQWALQTSYPGEPQADVLARASAYEAYLLEPLQSGFTDALAERQTATVN